MSKLAQKVALVTGGSRGIGAAISKRLAADGARVAFTYSKDASAASAVVKEIELNGGKAIAIQADATDVKAVEAAVEKTFATFGRLDVLVNNAGFQRTHRQLEELSPAEVDHTFRTNIQSMFYLTQAAAPHMSPGSAIVNTTSIQADDPSPELLAYAATKGAIANFTSASAQLLAKQGIRVNAVAPGPVWTPLIPSTMPTEKAAKFGSNTPLGRPAQPSELAPAYVFLASDEASYITGAVLPVTGGRPML
jgi:NAD(P)-dependent dehydrogenase (short-subunit alcohol dehydrogenase family)